MKIYLISQTANDGYDTYDSAVVVAENEDEARAMSPRPIDGGKPFDFTHNWYTEWADKVESVEVMEIGVPIVHERRVICASYNAW